MRSGRELNYNRGSRCNGLAFLGDAPMPDTSKHIPATNPNLAC